MPAATIDLRSDTVTRPTPTMRRAMADAEVGDDGYGEDPTVRELEETFAARVGKAAGLFTPSGTMANQIALRLLGRPGTAVLVGAHQHVVLYERGAAGANGAYQLVGLDDTAGVLDPLAVAAAVDAGAAHHWLPPAAVCAEDTHLFAGGRPWPAGALHAVAAAAGRLPLHLDGARLFNAEVATGVSAAERAAPATTVMCCLSKGLGAPVGSLLAGPADLIEAARIERKILGGSMRQAGVVAAAGIVALRDHVGRLAEDHERARRLALAVADRWPEAGVDPAGVETNIVLFDHPDPAGLLAYLASEGIRAGTIAPRRVRFVTHLDIDDDGVAAVEKAIAGAA